MKRAVTWACSVIAGGAILLAAAPARSADQTVEHTIRSGDNLHLIAGYYYRDPRQWRRIWKLNRKGLRGASLLVPGKVLRIEAAAGQGWDVPYEEFRARVAGK
jgi:hypothetical protein